jgi:hypothetical protein
VPGQDPQAPEFRRGDLVEPLALAKEDQFGGPEFEERLRVVEAPKTAPDLVVQVLYRPYPSSTASARTGPSPTAAAVRADARTSDGAG